MGGGKTIKCQITTDNYILCVTFRSMDCHGPAIRSGKGVAVRSLYQEGVKMVDVTSTSFGLIIAYLLPGMTFLYGLSFFSNTVDVIFKSILAGNANISLFFTMIFTSTLLGIILSPLRWIVFECFFCRESRIDKQKYKALGKDETTLKAYRALIDEQFRYHQFYGGIVFAFPLLIFGILFQNYNMLETSHICIYIMLSASFEIVLFKAAIEAFNAHMIRAQSILGGE